MGRNVSIFVCINVGNITFIIKSKESVNLRVVRMHHTYGQMLQPTLAQFRAPNWHFLPWHYSSESVSLSMAWLNSRCIDVCIHQAYQSVV